MIQAVIGSDEITVNLDPFCEDTVCLTTIFGLFLQYPYVYLTTDHGNCLAGVQLVLVELAPRGSHVVMTSFSVPSAVCGGDEAPFRRLPNFLSSRRVVLDSVAM